MNFQTGDKVIAISKRHAKHYDGNWAHLQIGEEYIVDTSGRFDFISNEKEDAITVIDGYGGYYPSALFRLKESSYEIY